MNHKKSERAKKRCENVGNGTLGATVAWPPHTWWLSFGGVYMSSRILLYPKKREEKRAKKNKINM